jgi:exodeoxyribonuclease VII small subunit
MARKQPQDFESQMRRLREIVQELERADLPLEKNVALYKEGRALAKNCKRLLDKARHEISLCADGGESPFALEPGDGDADEA